MRICVLGTGYVGLVAGACFSDSGNHVICVDLDEEKLSKLRQAEVPFFEPGLDDVVRRNVKAGRLTFSSDSKKSIASSKVIFVAVGTPQAADGSSNLSYLEAAARTIADSIQQDCVVVLKSTVPVGTADKVRKFLET